MPLLEYWLDLIRDINPRHVVVNTHAHAQILKSFLNRPKYSSWVTESFEKKLLGTASTIRANYDYLRGDTTLVIHADNFIKCDFELFLSAHKRTVEYGCEITMMTFETKMPKSCGIVTVDNCGIARDFQEKVENPNGNLANAAIYIFEQSVIEWLKLNPSVQDISNELIPNFLGRIYCWKNNDILLDIGTPAALRAANKLIHPKYIPDDEWSRGFANLEPIKKIVAAIN